MSLVPSSINPLSALLYHISLIVTIWLPHSIYPIITQHTQIVLQNRKEQQKWVVFFTLLTYQEENVFPRNTLICEAHWAKLGHHRLSNKEEKLELVYPHSF